MMTAASSCGLDIIDILVRCAAGFVPVNVPADAAIAAHQAASGDEMRSYVLRSVILAQTPTRADMQKKIDYLSELPIGDWPALGDLKPEEIRNQTLAGIARAICWAEEN